MSYKNCAFAKMRLHFRQGTKEVSSQMHNMPAGENIAGHPALQACSQLWRLLR
jgi:hypothetical protein